MQEIKEQNKRDLREEKDEWRKTRNRRKSSQISTACQGTRAGALMSARQLHTAALLCCVVLCCVVLCCAVLHSLRSKRVFPVFVLRWVTVTEIQCLFILMQIRMWTLTSRHQDCTCSKQMELAPQLTGPQSRAAQQIAARLFVICSSALTQFPGTFRGVCSLLSSMSHYKGLDH
jgi:hypothetical protein